MRSAAPPQKGDDMEGAARHEPIDDVIGLIPRAIGQEDVLQRLRQYTRHLDSLTAIDDHGQPFVDRDAAAALLRGAVPADLHDHVQKEFEHHVGDKLKPKGGARHLGWREFAAHDNPIQPPSIEELRSLGFDGGASVEQTKAALRRHFPDLPERWLDADGPEVHAITLDALRHNRTVWDCVVAHLGFWAALAIFAAVGAFLIVGTATGPWGIPLAIWLIGVLGGGTAVIVLNCVLNPNL